MRSSLRRLLLVAAVPAVALLVASYFLWPGVHAPSAEPEPVPTFTLEELCRDDLTNGWRVKHPPGVAGPYRRRVSGFLYYHPGPDGSCTVRHREPSGAIVWEEQTRPGVDFLAIVLETSDGQRTEGLLVRGE